jgi:hypothetical protein
MLWQTLTGNSPDDPEFQAFVDAHVQQEIIQEIGRHRAHLSPEQQKTFYFVADYDISFLANEFPEAHIESVDVINLCPEAANEGSQTKWAILQAFKQLSSQREKITTTAVAAAAGVTQGCVSKIATAFGGWKQLEKLLRLLLSKLYSVGNNFLEADSDLQFMAQTYLPLVFDEPESDVTAAIKMLTEVYGWQGFEKIIGLMPIHSKAKLLAIILSLLPPDVGDDLKASTFQGLQMEATE